jgi:hypothetical protein
MKIPERHSLAGMKDVQFPLSSASMHTGDVGFESEAIPKFDDPCAITIADEESDRGEQRFVTAGIRTPCLRKLIPALPSSSPHGRLMLTVLAGLAEFERELIRARAKANGVKLGRKFKLTPHQRKEALARRDKGET